MNGPANGTTYTGEELEVWIGQNVEIVGLGKTAWILEIVPVRRGGSYPNNADTLLVRFETGEEGAGWLPADFV